MISSTRKPALEAAAAAAAARGARAKVNGVRRPASHTSAPLAPLDTQELPAEGN